VALSVRCLPLVEEPLCLLLRGAMDRCSQYRGHRRSSDGGLAPAIIGGGVAKRSLLADLGELAVKTAMAPGGCLRGGDGAVEGPTAARSGSLQTHSGVASDLASAERRAALRRSYHACYLAVRSSSDMTALKPEGLLPLRWWRMWQRSLVIEDGSSSLTNCPRQLRRGGDACPSIQV